MAYFFQTLLNLKMVAARYTNYPLIDFRLGHVNPLKSFCFEMDRQTDQPTDLVLDASLKFGRDFFHVGLKLYGN